jgi:hypothetical protein
MGKRKQYETAGQFLKDRLIASDDGLAQDQGAQEIY